MSFEPTEKIWMDGEFVNWADANVHILTHTLHYGNGVFEGIRAYETDRGPAVFRLTPHIERLFDSANILNIEIPFSREEMIEAVKETIRINDMTSCYIRPIVYLGYGEVGLNPLLCEVKASIAVWSWGRYLGEESAKQGVRVMVSSWARHDPNAMPTSAKGCGHYINSQLAKVQAVRAGYDEAILLNTQGRVSECTGENLFIVKNSEILTPPASAGALAGITKDCIRIIAQDLGIGYREVDFFRTDMYVADEAFLSGTAAEVVPIRSVDDRELRSTPGPITQKIQEVFYSAVVGEVDRYKDWNEYVKE